MTTQGAVQQSSPDVHLTIEQDGEQRVRIQSAQLREIGEQLRGPRSFSIFNSLVLPALVALLTTILTSGFQYVSWRNSVLLQNANDVVTRATEAYEAATEMIGKRRYSTLLFVPAMRDIISANTPALADANESAKPAEPKQPGGEALTIFAQSPVDDVGSLLKLESKLVSVRFEAYYHQLKLWNETYDKLLTDVDHHLDRPIYLDTGLVSEPESKYGKRLASINCRQPATDELVRLQLNSNSLKLRLAIIRECFSQLNDSLDEKKTAVKNGHGTFDQQTAKRARDELWYIHMMANEFRCFALNRIEYYRKQKELSIVGTTLLRNLTFLSSQRDDAERHFAETHFRCRPGSRPI